MSQQYPSPHEQQPYGDQPRTGGSGSNLAMVAHLGGILTYFFAGWVASLVVLLVERDRPHGAREEARVALNFQLTLLIAMVVGKIINSLPLVGIIGWILMLAVGIVGLVLSILAAITVSRGASYRYPFSLELVR